MAAEPSVSKGMKGDLYRRGETRVHIWLWDRTRCCERRMRWEIFDDCVYFDIVAS